MERDAEDKTNSICAHQPMLKVLNTCREIPNFLSALDFFKVLRYKRYLAFFTAARVSKFHNTIPHSMLVYIQHKNREVVGERGEVETLTNSCLVASS